MFETPFSSGSTCKHVRVHICKETSSTPASVRNHKMASNIAALVFGLNYAHYPDSALAGCVYDANTISQYLINAFGADVTKHTDDSVENGRAHTTRQGMITALTAFAARSRNLRFAWVHFSGHGTQVRDASGDEPDGKDECIVPSDYKTAGFITDDQLRGILATFAPTCRVVVVLDSCHSGTAVDLKYLWGTSAARTPQVQNKLAIAAPVLLLSGCGDSQTSADAYGLVPGEPQQASGALTSCLLKVLQTPRHANNVFTICSAVTNLLIAGRFTQRPRITTSYLFRGVPFGQKLLPDVPEGRRTVRPSTRSSVSVASRPQPVAVRAWRQNAVPRRSGILYHLSRVRNVFQALRRRLLPK